MAQLQKDNRLNNRQTFNQDSSFNQPINQTNNQDFKYQQEQYKSKQFVNKKNSRYPNFSNNQQRPATQIIYRPVTQVQQRQDQNEQSNNNFPSNPVQQLNQEKHPNPQIQYSGPQDPILKLLRQAYNLEITPNALTYFNGQLIDQSNNELQKVELKYERPIFMQPPKEDQLLHLPIEIK